MLYDRFTICHSLLHDRVSYNVNLSVHFNNGNDSWSIPTSSHCQLYLELSIWPISRAMWNRHYNSGQIKAPEQLNKERKVHTTEADPWERQMEADSHPHSLSIHYKQLYIKHEFKKKSVASVIYPVINIHYQIAYAGTRFYLRRQLGWHGRHFSLSLSVGKSH